MAKDPVKHCPECLSALEGPVANCPHCGAVLAKVPQHRQIWPSTILVVLAALVVGAYLTFRDPTPVPNKPTDPLVSEAPAKSQRPSADSPPPQRPQREHSPLSAFWVLRAEHEPETRVPLLALRPEAPGPATLFLPTPHLPLEGALTDAEGRPILLNVLHLDLTRQFILLTPEGELPEQVSPMRVRKSTSLDIGETLQIVDETSMNGIGSTLFLRREAEFLRMDKALPKFSALVDHDGAAVGYSFGGNTALPLDPALFWLGRTGLGKLGEAQSTVRAANPRHVLEDVNELARKPSSIAKVRRALSLVEHCRPFVQDRDWYAALDDAERRLHHLLVRLLSAEDPAAALQHAQQALARFPDHHGLLADMVLLSIKNNPEGAIALYDRLRGQSPEHAAEIADSFIEGLTATADKRIKDGRFQEGLSLLEWLVGIFPRRADLYIRYARALSRASRHTQARIAAETATSLDPSYAELLEDYRRAERTATTAGKSVEIPFDPDTLLIQATVRVGGKPLELVVDTGASLTTIPSSMARQLGLLGSSKKRVKIDTAGGTIEAELVQLPSLQIGPITILRISAVIIDLPGSLGNKGLLGQNVLRRMNVQFDSQNHKLVLRKTRRKRR